MSGTLSNIYNNVSFALNQHMTELIRLQEQAFTGSQINRASDDPSSAYRVLGLNSQQRTLENYMDNIAEAVGILEISYTVVEDMMSAFAETKVLLTQIMNGIYGQEGRERTAIGINNTLEQMVLLANTKHLNQYLFGGSNTGSAPYAVERTNGEITSVTYQGSFQDRDIEVAPGVESNAFHIGDNIFRSDDRSTPVFLGDTGAAPGSGTSNVKGDVWLTIADESPTEYKLSIDGTNYINVDKGIGSEEQTLTFSAAPTSGSFTLTFNGQKTAAITFGQGASVVETALENLSNLDEGDVTVTGTFSTTGLTITFVDTFGNVPELVPGDNTLDGGATTITPNTTTEGIGDTNFNLAVTDTTGRVLYVNTTGITSTGDEMVSVPGTYDIFNTLIGIRDILENENGLSDAKVVELINNSISSLEEIRSFLVGQSVSMGSKIGFLDDLKGTLENMKFNTEDESTGLQDADIAQIAIDISRRNVLYQMSLAIAAKLASMSLLDFIK